MSVTGYALPSTTVVKESGEPWLTTRALTHVLVIAGLFCGAVALTLLVVFDGWEYYRAPLTTRGYLPAHALLRPSGAVGLTLGVGGVVAMLCTIPYAVRKRWKRLSTVGALKNWLEMHIFFGVVGPVLITFHTSFKFNGLISVGYWLMMTVWASGFVGRYLYVRIPKTIRGVELSRREVEARLDALREQLRSATMAEAARRHMDAFDASIDVNRERACGVMDLFFGETAERLRLFVLARRLRAAGVNADTLRDCIALAAERSTLARRAAHLQRTHRLFEAWHVFHRPLVSAMFLIVGIHVAVALYLGYARLFL
jgi:hypothetical protein